MQSASENWFYELAKRGLDVGVAITALVLLGLPMLAIAAAIKLESHGPVFYRGERVGRYGKGFRIFKLRSMGVHQGGPETTSTDDQRVTAIGRFIRKFKIDELPQLINVLKGEMSLVGPRPEVRWCVEMYTDEEKEILTVRPGITDWSSIKFNNEGEIVARSGYADANQAYLDLIRPEKLRLQLRYVRERNLGVDVKILWQTIATLGKTRSTMLGNAS
jgi:lipopolysaccharide/colanic/teichoic acid biosynthesis glycosyltransferase